MIDYAVLRQELTQDPLGLGYAGKRDAARAALLNAVVGPGAWQADLPAVPKNKFLKLTVPAAVRLATATATDGTTLGPKIVARWQAVFGHVYHVDPATDIDLSFLAQAVADKVMTQAELDGVGVKTGSRAEKLFGVGTVISEQHIGEARNGA